MVISVVTLFPDMFSGVFGASMVKRAQTRGLVDVRLVPLRTFGVGPRRAVDDYPFGGGVGMLMRVDVVVPAVEWAIAHVAAPAEILITSAQGERFDQAMAEDLAHKPHVVVVAGHYEGIDERARQILGAREVSVGDYVLTGGEIPAMILVDALIRLLPGALGAEAGARQDSFSRPGGGLEGPQYTRPEEYRGWRVPPVLLSGHHERIRAWQEAEAEERTRQRRPDLLSAGGPDPAGSVTLDESVRLKGGKEGNGLH
ncbi:MAG: tRNA (guanosine(37)-N1)-methyltransferase TrmD [Thermaerobacter sp.]|nr:tRNA (guanosine(37)-N1)-methyltransferase TrmD [Thermaerobacter sp.]